MPLQQLIPRNSDALAYREVEHLLVVEKSSNEEGNGLPLCVTFNNWNDHGSLDRAEEI